MESVFHHIKHRPLVLYLILMAILALASCQHKEEYLGTETPLRRASFSVAIDDHEKAIETKSVLNDDVETKLTSLTVAVYDNNTGSMVGVPIYKTDSFDSIVVTLEPDESVTLYALANMGDMSSSFPSEYNESAINEITYRIPGYTTATTGVNARGIPMAGKLVFNEGMSEDVTIMLKRLMAKLIVHVNVGWEGFISSAKLCNLNAVLRPFGQSAAASTEDLFSSPQEIAVMNTAIKEGGFVFYVTENMLGQASGNITNSKDKSHDNPTGDENIDAIKDLATYMEVEVTGDATYGYDGSVTYRSYLGKNKLTDFDIIRNDRYEWMVNYLPDNMPDSDWKHFNEMSWRTYSYNKFLAWPSWIYLHQTKELYVGVYYNQYTNGVLTEKNQYTNAGALPASTYFAWTFDPENIITSTSPSKTDTYYIYGENPGTTTVTLNITDLLGTTTLDQSITVLNMSRDLFLRTPAGDFYDGDTFSVPYGTTWDNIQVGVKRTAGTSVSTVCPLVVNSDNLQSVNVLPYLTSNYALRLMSPGDNGKNATFSFTFTESDESRKRLLVTAAYKDFNNESTSFKATVNYTLNEALSIETNATSSRISPYGAGISCTGYSDSGTKTNITTSSNYTWSTKPTGTSSVTLSGGKRVVTSTKAGTVTVRVQKNGDSAVYCEKQLTFTDNEEYRFTATPTSINVVAGESFDKSAFTFYKERWVNGSYVSRETIASNSDNINLYITSGYTSKLSRNASTNTITAASNATGTAMIYARINDSSIASSYRSVDITVNIQEPDNYALSISPASKTVSIGETQSYTYTLTKNGSPITGTIVWESSNTSVATINSSGVATAKAAGTATIRAYYPEKSGALATATATLTVQQDNWALSISPTSQTIFVGKTQSYSYTLTKNGSPVSGAVVWESSNTSVATINSNGVATGQSAGTTTIRAYYPQKSGALASASATLTVQQDVWTITFNPTNLSVSVGSQKSFSIAVTHNGSPVSYSASDIVITAPSMVTATLSGTNCLVSGVSLGSTSVTVSYRSGGVEKCSGSVPVTVVTAGGSVGDGWDNGGQIDL